MAESRGVQSDLIPRIATGFCGGLARTGGICGAVSGAIMAINLVYGRIDPRMSPEENYAKVREFIAEFEKTFGTTNCKALISCDLGTDDGQKMFKANNTIERCKGFTEAAVEMVIKIL